VNVTFAETVLGFVQLFYPRESRRVARSACSASSNERSADRSRQTHAAPLSAAQVLTAHEVGGVNVRSSVTCPRALRPDVPERRRFLAAASPRRSAIDLKSRKVLPLKCIFPGRFRDEKFNCVAKKRRFRRDICDQTHQRSRDHQGGLMRNFRSVNCVSDAS
jgi:hypothetical protein